MDGTLYVFNKRGILNCAECVTKKLGVGAMMETVRLFSSHMLVVATSIGWRAFGISSAFLMSSSVKVEMSVFFRTFKERKKRTI